MDFIWTRGCIRGHNLTRWCARVRMYEKYWNIYFIHMIQEYLVGCHWWDYIRGGNTLIYPPRYQGCILFQYQENSSANIMVHRYIRHEMRWISSELYGWVSRNISISDKFISLSRERNQNFGIFDTCFNLSQEVTNNSNTEVREKRIL